MVRALYVAHCDSLLILFSVLVNNLCVHIKPMFQLYGILKDHEELLTPDEIAIASRQMELNGHAAAEYLNKLTKALENIKKAFEDQKAWATVSEDYLLNHLVLTGMV